MSITILQIVAYVLFLAFCLYIIDKVRVKHVKYYKSKINKFIDVRKNKLDELYMTLNGYTQGIEVKKDLSNQGLDKSYWYFCAKSLTDFCKNIKHPKILLLGLGAGTVPNIINQLDLRISMTVVEYDPVVIQVCKDYFHLNNLANTTILNADAFKYVAEQSELKEKFDAVLIDLFISEAPYVSPESQNYNFIKSVSRLIKDAGLFVLNRPANDNYAKEDHKKFMELVQKMFKEYKHTEIIDPRNYYNYIVEGRFVQPEIT